jgi:ketosteroid isomerase-like protein
MMKRLAFAFTIFLAACNTPVDIEKETQRILQTDREFAVLSVQSGAAEAFRLYAQEDAILLPPNEEPVRGRDMIVQGFVEFDKKFILDWEPQAAEVAASGDLAYSWGTSTGTSRETGTAGLQGQVSDRVEERRGWELEIYRGSGQSKPGSFAISSARKSSSLSSAIPSLWRVIPGNSLAGFRDIAKLG